MKLFIIILLILIIASLAFTLDINPIDRINEVRAGSGTGSLVRNPVLDSFAQYRIGKLTESELDRIYSYTWYHDNYAEDFVCFLRGKLSPGYYYGNEIVIISRIDLNTNKLIDLWLDSPAHKKAMLDNRYTSVGYCSTEKFGSYIIFIDLVGKVK